MANRPMKKCARCGAPFEQSRQDSTVNCPSCRNRSSSTLERTRDARVKKVAKSPKDMRAHLWEYHAKSSLQMEGQDLNALHAASHAETSTYGKTAHRHGA